MRFTIRELLLLFALIGMATGWIVDHRRQNSKIRQHVGYIYACLHRLEDHGEMIKTDGDSYYVRADNSNDEWQKFFTASTNKLYPISVPLAPTAKP